jgi:hypothetical protein
MPTSPRDDILAAIRKRGRFDLDLRDAVQAKRWGDAAVQLFLAGVIDCEEAGDRQWCYTKGPQWNRRA